MTKNVSLGLHMFYIYLVPETKNVSLGLHKFYIYLVPYNQKSLSGTGPRDQKCVSGTSPREPYGRITSNYDTLNCRDN